MKTEIIAVGTELLLGQIVNTNASFLSEELANIGYEVYYQSVVGDNSQRLEELLVTASKRSELVILCGGLGPTEDDLTKEAVASFVGSSLETDQAALAKLEARIKVTNKVLTPNNLKQAQYIAGGEVIQNDRGLAIGSLVSSENVRYLLLPGPPSELKAMVKDHVIPKLVALMPSVKQLTSRVLRFYGIGESALATQLDTLIEQQQNPTIALYAKENEVTVRLTAKGENETANLALITQVETQILAVCGQYFYGYGEDNNLIKETFKLLPKADIEEIGLYDYFTDGRLTTAWQSEGDDKLTLHSRLASLKEGQLITEDGQRLSTDDLTTSNINDYHQTMVQDKPADLSVLIIGTVSASHNGAFYEGESWLSVRYKGEFYSKKTVYAGNKDTIKDRGVLETTSFLREIIR